MEEELEAFQDGKLKKANLSQQNDMEKLNKEKLSLQQLAKTCEIFEELTDSKKMLSEEMQAANEKFSVKKRGTLFDGTRIFAYFLDGNRKN